MDNPFFTTRIKDGRVLLEFGCMRAGHWPGSKAPPWGISDEGPLYREAERRGIPPEQLELPGELREDGNEPISLTIKYKKTSGFFAFPDHPEQLPFDL